MYFCKSYLNILWRYIMSYDYSSQLRPKESQFSKLERESFAGKEVTFNPKETSESEWNV